eukprot:scaffold18693_cov101-Isochrysis_galbana.AAC.4
MGMLLKVMKIPSTVLGVELFRAQSAFATLLHYYTTPRHGRTHALRPLPLAHVPSCIITYSLHFNTPWHFLSKMPKI